MQNALILTAPEFHTEFRAIIREELEYILSQFNPQNSDADVIGGIELAVDITGWKRQTIYAKCAALEIPHFKAGGKLRFSKNDLIQYVRDGKRKTHTELAAEAVNHITKKTKHFDALNVAA